MSVTYPSHADAAPASLARCTAHSKRTGNPCSNRPIDGATVCRMHGGSTPQVKQAAARRVALAHVTAWEAQSDRSPDEILREALYRCSAEMQMAAADYDQHHDAERQASYERWVERSAKVSKLAIDAGLSERQVRVLEEQGRMLGEVLAAIRDDPRLTLTIEQRQTFEVVVGERLQRLSAA